MLVSINDERLIAGFTTKFGGVSAGAFARLNLATHVGDDPSAVQQNREILRQRLGAKRLIFMEQIHSDIVVDLGDLESNLAQNLESNLKPNLTPCDSVITGAYGVCLCVMVADCSPVLLFDKRRNLVAAIHAGRAGVLGKIISKTIAKMHSNPSDIRAIIGPNIKKKCYEIGALELGEFSKFGQNGYFDMDAAIKFELENLGVAKFEFSSICSHCDERFYSYRKSGQTGRFAGFIMLKG